MTTRAHSNMERILIVVSVLTLVACAPNSYIREQQFGAYRQQVAAEFDQGRITPSKMQEKLRDRYREIYGHDQEMERYYAYAISFLRGAEEGRYDLKDAQARVTARREQLLAQRARQKAEEDYTDNYR